MMSSSGAPTSPMTHLLRSNVAAARPRATSGERGQVTVAVRLEREVAFRTGSTARLRSCGSTCSRSFPAWSRLRRPEPAGQGARSGGCSTCGSTTSDPRPTDPHRIGRRQPVRRRRGHGADARADLRSPSRRSRPPRPLLLLGPGGRRFDQAFARDARRLRRASASCAAGTRASTTGSARHLVDGELSVGDYVLAGGEVAAHGGARGGQPPGPRRHGQRGVGGRRVVRRRAARVPAVHPTGRVPGPARCPTCCGRAITTGSPAGVEPERCSGRCATGPT